MSKIIEAKSPKQAEITPTPQPKKICFFKDFTNKITLKIGNTKNEKTNNNPTNFTEEVTTTPNKL